MRKILLRVSFAATFAFLLIVATGCTESVGPDDGLTGNGGGNATMQLFVHDAPADYIAAAEVQFSRAYLTGGGGNVDVISASDGPQVMDLMQLQNGIRELLASTPVPAGRYSQLRMVVDHADVTLLPGYTYEDGSTTQRLTIPSGDTTGVKVQLAGSLELTEGMTTILAVDFDVNQSFVMRGDPTNPSGIEGFTFVPVITETDREQVSG